MSRGCLNKRSRGSRAEVTTTRALALAFVLVGCTSAAVAHAKPTRDQQAAATEQKAMRAYGAGDLPQAVRVLEQGLKTCESGCSAKAKARLHVSLGTVYGVGAGDYVAAKREFVIALSLDPDAHLKAMTTPALSQAFEEARGSVGGAPPDSGGPQPPAPPVEKPQEKPQEKPLDVSDLFHSNDKDLSPTTKKVEAIVIPEPNAEERPRTHWFSVRPVFDLGHLSQANVCGAVGAPGPLPGWYCTDENTRPYTGTPQPNGEVTSGFAFSSARVLLGYEHVFFSGFTAGAFLGVGSNFSPVPATGRSGSALPLSAEIRASYMFGPDPYVDKSPARFHPYVFASMSLLELDTRVTIRVYEVPCASGRVSEACRRDLSAFRLSEGLFGGLGAGLRFKIEGRHAVRAAVRANYAFGDGLFVVSPEAAYEFGI